MKKIWYKNFKRRRLGKTGQKARDLARKICKVLTIESNRRFYAKMNCENNIYEAHIIDTGHCQEIKDFNYIVTGIEDDMDIGSIFFGGHYSRLKYKDAEERAWTSLILDIIGKSNDIEIRKFHNLTRALETFGPHLNFNFENIEELNIFLNGYDV